MSSRLPNRIAWRRSAIEAVERFLVPGLWLLTLAYQFVFAAMFLDDASQTMAFVLHERHGIEPAAIWGWLCDGYRPLMLVTWALWLAVCPRALTAMVSPRADRDWAQRRLGNCVLLAFGIGLSMHAAWLALLLRTHGAKISMLHSVVHHALIRYEWYVPIHVLVNSLIPVTAWALVLFLRPGGLRDPRHWIAATWSLLIAFELNFAFAFTQSRMLMHFAYGHAERIGVLGRPTFLAVVLLGLLFEYRQVWQARLGALLDRPEEVKAHFP